jgi:hypothetical protein
MPPARRSLVGAPDARVGKAVPARCARRASSTRQPRSCQVHAPARNEARLSPHVGPGGRRPVLPLGTAADLGTPSGRRTRRPDRGCRQLARPALHDVRAGRRPHHGPNSVVLNVAIVPLREPDGVDLRARLSAGVTPLEIRTARRSGEDARSRQTARRPRADRRRRGRRAHHRHARASGRPAESGERRAGGDLEPHRRSATPCAVDERCDHRATTRSRCPCTIRAMSNGGEEHAR